MNSLLRKILLILGTLVFCSSLFYCYKSYEMKKRMDNSNIQKHDSKLESDHFEKNETTENNHSGDIGDLTQEDKVIDYLKSHHELPDYYITKSQAKKQGWRPGSSLCESVPGKAIGGDHFSNREKTLPAEGRKWTEADLNYNCGKRGADRLVFSDDNLIFVTHDHYKTFEKR